MIELGFIIVCPTMKFHDFTLTLSSVETYVREHNVVCVLPPTKDVALQTQFNTATKSYRSKLATIPSMINKGIKYSKTDWNMVLVAGSRVKTNLSQKLSLINFEEMDIIYPVTQKKQNFLEAPLDGIFINKKMFKIVGDFEEWDNAEYAKILWTAEAAEANCTFKGLVNLRIV